MPRFPALLTWSALLCVAIAPLVAAALSPLLAWRQSLYIVAGFAGIVAMALLLFQPMLAAGLLPQLTRVRARRMHQWVGTGLILCIAVHVIGLWITSPPDVIDSLLFRSPTPFAVWGVMAMWALFISFSLVLLRRKLTIQARTWRRIHRSLAVIVVIGSVVHAVLIDGTMETLTKWVLCVSVLASMSVALGSTVVRKS